MLHLYSRLKDMTLEAMLGTLEATVQAAWSVAVAVPLVAHRFNHWSSYRLSLHQTWRELKLRPRSSINWMINIFAGTSTDPKADFTFFLNAGFYFEIFNLAFVHAILYPVLIVLMYLQLQAKTTPASNADLEEGDELEGTHWYIEANVGFAEAVWDMATGSLVTLCISVLGYGLGVVLRYIKGYLLFSGVLMSKNRCVVCCSNMYLLLMFLEGGFVHEDLDNNRDLKSVLSNDDRLLRNDSSVQAYRLISKALYAKWTNLLLDLMMMKCAFHIRFNTDKTTPETESLLQQKKKV